MFRDTVEFSPTSAEEDWIVLASGITETTGLDDFSLGRGPFLIIDGLAVGEHEITLTVTNSAGKSASQSVTVTIVRGTGGAQSLYLPSVQR